MNVNFVVAYTHSHFSTYNFDIKKNLFSFFEKAILSLIPPPAPLSYKTVLALQEKRQVSMVAFSAFNKKHTPFVDPDKRVELWKDYVSLCAENLKNAPTDIKNNAEIVKAAVQKNGLTLAYASPELRNDPYIVLIAVTNCGLAYHYASDSCKSCRYIALAACRENMAIYEHLSDSLKKDPDIMSLLKHYNA
jgi:Domain of unknown function (DUF4116)